MKMTPTTDNMPVFFKHGILMNEYVISELVDTHYLLNDFKEMGGINLKKDDTFWEMENPISFLRYPKKSYLFDLVTLEIPYLYCVSKYNFEREIYEPFSDFFIDENSANKWMNDLLV